MLSISVQHGGYTNKRRFKQERKGRGDIDIHIKDNIFHPLFLIPYLNILDEVIFFFFSCKDTVAIHSSSGSLFIHISATKQATTVGISEP